MKSLLYFLVAILLLLFGSGLIVRDLDFELGAGICIVAIAVFFIGAVVNHKEHVGKR